MFENQIVIDHSADLFVRKEFDLVYLVRGSEAVKEMYERNSRTKSGRLCDKRHVVRLLHIRGCYEAESRGSGSHYVLVVTKDRKSLRGQRSGGDVKHGRRKFTGDLVHIGQHQHQAL
jgi:hypothetical protein